MIRARTAAAPLLLLLGAMLGTACASHIRRADDLVRAGRMDEAQVTLEAGLTEMPEDLALRFALARLHVGRRRWVEAEEELRTILTADKAHRAGRVLLVDVLEAVGAQAQAAFQLGRLRELHGRDVVPDERFKEALLLAADALLSAGEQRGGIALIERAVAEGLVPAAAERARLASAWAALAPRLSAEGRREEAVHAWEQAQRYDPLDAQIPLARGRLLAELRRSADADAAFAEHVRLSAEDPTGQAAASHRIGRWFEERGEPAPAAPHFERAWALDPTRGDSLLSLGRQRLELRELPRARDAFRRYVALAGDTADTHRVLGEAARGAGARRLAEEHLALAMKRDPQDPRAVVALAGLLAARGAMADARTVMEGYVDVSSDPAAAAFAAAEWAASQDDDAFAIDNYERSARANPERTVTFLRLYDLYRQARRAEAADDALTRYVAASPDKAASHATVADRLRVERRYDRAAWHLRKAVQARPDDPGPWRALARVHRDARQPQQEEEAHRALVRRARDGGATLLSVGRDYKRREDWARARTFLELAAAEGAHPVSVRQEALFLLAEVRWKMRDRPGMRRADEAFVRLAVGPEGRARAWARLEERYRDTGLMEDQRWALLEQVRLHPERPELHLRLGSLQLRRGDRDSTDAAFRKYVAKSTDKVRALHAVATRYRRANDYDAALAAYRRIREVAPGDPRFLQYTADIYRSRQAEGDRERAAKLYDALLGGAGADDVDLGKLGHQLYLGQYYAQAAAAYERLLGGATLRGLYALELAVSHLKLGRVERAREVFDAWLEGEGGEARSHLEVARKYRDARRYVDALRHYGAVLESAGPELDAAYAEAADVLAAQGDRAALLRITQDYVERARNEVRAREQAADKLTQGGLGDEAVAQWRRVLALRPNSALALGRLTDLLYSQGRAEEAALYVSRLIEEAGSDPRSWLEAGQGLRARGALEEALEFYRRALSPRTPRDEIQIARGEILLALGRWDEAREAFDEALGAARSKRGPLEKVGDLYERHDRADDTVAHWVRATTLDPTHADHHTRLVGAHLRAGHVEKARRALLAAKAQAPGGRTAIARAFERAGHVEDAASLYQDVLEAGADQHLKEAFLRLAGIRLAQGRQDALAPAIQRFVTTARARPQAHQVVARAFASAGQYASAYAHARLALRGEPTEKLWADAAWYALADGRDQAALDATMGRVRLADNPSDSAAQIVHDLVGRGRKDLAFRLIERLEVEGGSTLRGDLPRTALLLAAGDLAGAFRAARRHMASADDGADARREVAQAFFARGLKAEAAQLLEEASSAADAPPDVLLDLAEALFDQGRSAEGRRALERWLEAMAGTERAEQLSLVAGALLHGAGLWEEAGVRLAEATAHPRRAEAQRALRWQLLSLSSAGRGPADFRRAVDAYLALRPNRQEAYHDAVGTLFKQHRLALAMEVAQEGLGRFPRYDKLVEFLVVIHLRRGDQDATGKAIQAFLGLPGAPLDQRLADLATMMDRELRWKDAARLRRELLDLAPGGRQVLLPTARSDFMSGHAARGLDTLRRYVDEAPHPPRAARAAAEALLDVGEPGHALAYAQQAVRGDPDDPRGWFTLSVAALRKGERDSEAERRYVAQAADAPRARIFLARRLLYLGRRPQLGSPRPPDAWLQAALALLSGRDPSGGASPEAALWALATEVCLGVEGRATELAARLPHLPSAWAKDPLERRRGEDPNPPPPVAALAADLLLREGEHGPADAALRLWVARADKPATALHQGAFELARKRESPALMRRWLDEFDRRYADHSSKVTLLAEALEAAGDEAGAEAVYRKALARNPRAGVYMNNLAYLLGRRRRGLEEGLELVRTAERLQPQSNKYYFDTEGWVLYRMGRTAQARERILASIRLMNAGMGPAVSESFFHLGSASRDLRRIDEARWAFRTAAVLDPWGVYGQRSAEALATLGDEGLESLDSPPAIP